MGYGSRVKFLAGAPLILWLMTSHACAFALLGPYEDWMQPTNGFRHDADIGGPMNLGDEYRWNVPVLTYAFDQSFLNYFGTNGVLAVEQSIQILNALPPASQLNPSNYPPAALRNNYQAGALGLTDLKSQILHSLLEQLGLTEPTRYMYCVQSFTFNAGMIQPTIIQRNFDPISFTPSSAVNDSEYGYGVSPSTNGLQISAVAQPFLIDPLDTDKPTIADNSVTAGGFYSDLTRDDAGGLRYLLSTNNANAEILLPDVHGVGANASSYVSHALRQGVDKITFVRPNCNSLLGQFSPPFTNQFTDRYITNGVVVEQQLERVITRPDILFSTGDPAQNVYGLPFVARTSTSNWWSGTALPGTGGPGVIRPPVTMIFSRPGPTLQTDDAMPEGFAVTNTQSWGSFDASVNPPVVYPIGSYAGGDMTIRLRILASGNAAGSFNWQVPASAGGTVTLQTSTNLTDWVSLMTMINQGTVVEWQHHSSRAQRFFRVVPQ